MAEQGKKAAPSSRISEQQRFRYIGFDVFPGKPKDLFRNEEERNKHIEAIVAKRKRGEVLRDHCSLFEERVSLTDRLVLTIASLLIVVSLFLPWFAVSNTIVEESKPSEPVQLQEPGEADDAMADTAAMTAVPTDTGAVAATTAGGEAAAASPADEVASQQQGEGAAVASTSEGSAEEVIHGYVAVKKKIHKEYRRVSGIGMFASLGTVGSDVFSSGLVLVVTAILVLVYAVLCLLIPGYTLFSLFGQKGGRDERALKLKKVLRLNWVPVVLFVVMFILSFFGAEYSFDPAVYDSIGDSYSVATFLGSLTWGVLLTLAAFILVAVKGIEI
jgi:hypothetical protein